MEHEVFKTIAGLKTVAKKIQKLQNIPRHEALDLAARRGGFQNYLNAKRSLEKTFAIPQFSVEIRARWRDWQTRERGTAKIIAQLSVPLCKLVRPHAMHGYLSGFKVENDSNLVDHPETMIQDKGITIYSVFRAANTLAFMQATGLQPSEGHRRCYPKGNYRNRPPIADHDKYWFDPEARTHILSVEPYDDRIKEAQRDWENRHGWSTLRSHWGSIYGLGSTLFFCCPNSYVDKLIEKLSRLEKCAPVLSEENVEVELVR